MIRFNRVAPCLLASAAVLSMAAPTYAQSYYGTLKGLVKDPAGAAVANAQVTITDEATKISRSTVTTGSGEYVFNAVDPGTFTIKIVQAGFSEYERKGVTVQTQNTVAIDVPLQVGSSATVVEVTTAEPSIDSSTAQNGQVFDTQKLVDLPQLGRNPFLLAKLNNNVTATGDPRFNRFQDQSGSSAISIAGGPVNMNNYLIDGVPITDVFNRAVIIPSVEAVQEIKIQANAYDAEAGRTGGGVFNTLLKSGTNALHGTLYGSTRQTNWSANTWQNNYTGAGRPNITQYSYEGSLGGPIIIPKIYNGTDKTFFFVAEEGYRQRSPLGATFFLPTDAERAGDFSASGLTIYDPSTTTAAGNRTAFAGNVIPRARINPVGAAILAGLPHCAAGCNNAVSYGTINFRPTDLLGDRADEFISKVDHQFFKFWLANASYLHYGSKEPGGNPLGSFAGTGGTSYLLYRKVDAFSQNNVFTLNPTTILTVAYGQNRFPNNTLDLTSNYNQATQLGFPAAYAAALQKAAFPAITMQQTASFGTNNSGPAAFYNRNLVVSAAKSLGKHSIKAGYNFRTLSLDFTNVSSGNGSYSFQNTFTSANPNPATGSPQGGADLADLLLGLPTAGSVQVVTRLALNVHYNAVYVQDDIRVNEKLTVNAGLRYEYEPGIRERSNHYAVGFDKNVASPLQTSSGGVVTKGGVEFAGQNGYKDHCCNNGALKFDPRVGFAYSVTPAMVIRGGYGVFSAPIYYSNSASLAPGYAQTSTYVASNNSNKTPAHSLSDPFPVAEGGILQPVGNAAGLSQGIGSSLTVIDQTRRNPLIQQFSLDIQQDLGHNLSLEMGFVGAHGRNLLPSNGGTFNIDQIQRGAIPFGVGSCPTNPNGLSDVAFLKSNGVNPYAGKGGTGAINAASISNSQLCRPFPQFTSVNEQPSASQSNYESLILNARKRYSNGLSLTTGYTWSKNLDSQWAQTSALNVGASGAVQNVYNINGPGGEYSNAINDLPHRFTFAGTYDLPFGRGKMLLGNSSKLVDLLVGGWQANMTFVAQDGGPVPIQLNSNQNSIFGALVQRPNLVAGVNPCTTGSVQSRLSNYFNKAAFSTPAQGDFGNTPRTLASCRAPGLRTSDASVFKDFQFERVHFRFQAEAANVFNTPEFALNSNGRLLNNAQFGTVNTSTINFPRLISLGGRISF